MAKPIGPLFRSEVIIITPIRRRRPKRLRIFALFMLTLFGIYYFMELSFGSSKKYDILIILTNDVCSKGGHDLGTMNNGGAPSRFHCVMKCSGKSHAHSGGGNSCGRLMLVLGAKNSSPIIVCENPTNNVVTIIPEILNGVNWPEVLTNTATLDSIKNRYNTDKKITNLLPKHCGKDCMKMNIIFNYTRKIEDSTANDSTVESNKHTEKINSIAIIVVKNLPACIVLVNFNHMVFWSDIDRGTIEMFNLDLNIRFTLVKNLTTPGSMAVDPKHKYLFWSNNQSEGSIGRIDFDGNNQIDITLGKYTLKYPSRLVVDQNNSILYWTADGIIHRSDFNGNEHSFVVDRKAYDLINPGCLTISKSIEHGIFWNEKTFDVNFRHTINNFYLLLTNLKENDVFKLPVNECSSMIVHCLHTCLRNPIGYHCVCLDVDKETCQLNSSSYLKNYTLSMVGYEPITMKRLAGIDKNILNMIGGTSFHYNFKTQKIYYYDAKVKQIQVINMFYKTKLPILVVKNITSTNNGLTYDWLTNNLYFIDSDNRSIKVLGLNHYNPAPIVFAEDNSTIDALEILPRRGLLVFICRDLVSKTIYKSSLNGTNITIIAEMEEGSSDSFIIDSHEHTIYWSNIKNNSITTVNLDGDRHDTYSPPKIYRYIMELNKTFNLLNIWIDDNPVGFQFQSKTNIPKYQKKCSGIKK